MTKKADLNMEKLNDVGSMYSKITPIQDDTLIHGGKASNLFAYNYQQANTIHVTTHRNTGTTENHTRFR